MRHLHHKLSALHVVTDYKSGGIRFNVEDIVSSRLAQIFDFSVVLLDEAPYVLEVQPDLVLFHSACSWANIPKLLSLKQLGPVIIQENHYNEDFDQLTPSLERFHMMLRIMYGLADHVVAISENQGEWMLRNQLVKPHKLTVIPAAKNLDAFLTIPEPSLLWPLVLGAYGRFSPEKGFDVFLEALRYINLPIGVLLGGEGLEGDRLASMAQGLENFKFVGLVHDVPEFLKQCDIVVLPSRRETWGFTCMEAKAAARPVVASKVGGLSEQVVGCGLLIAPDNPRDLAESIRFLCSQDREMLQSLGRAGRQSVQGAWEHYLEQWDDLMHRVIGSKRPHRRRPQQT